ncbi:MAG: hypothetical protein AMXMBFR84_30890 [Candidatus Hydrogenedentota bacterium]
MRVPEYVHGCISNVFTMWDTDGRFHEAGQRRFLDYLVDTGSITSFFVRSGMGQMYAYEYDDVVAMARTACTHLAGKAPVIVGTAGVWNGNYDRRPDAKTFVDQGIALGKMAMEAGAAGVVHTMPEAILPNAGESYGDLICRYFETICGAAPDVPVLAYQPPRTIPEYRVDMKIIARLAEIPNMVAMKVSTADAQYLFNLCHAISGKDFAFIAGNENAFYAALYAGASACIGQGCTINAPVVRAIQDRFEAGDHEGALAAQWSTNHLCNEARCPVEFFKRYVTEKGYPVPVYARVDKNNPYAESPVPITQEQYDHFKCVLETEMAKYESVPVGV